MADWTDKEVEQLVGRLLQIGVSIAAVVVLAGGIFFLFQHGQETTDYHVFRGEQADLRKLPDIVEQAFTPRSRGMIQLGLLLLIATPVARVAFTVFAFLRERDYIFIAVTLFVLAVLLYSLFSGYLDI